MILRRVMLWMTTPSSVTGDHSFKHGCFPIQYLTTALGRILFSSVVMVLAFGALGHCFESCPDLIFLPCIYSFVSLLRTMFVRKYIEKLVGKGENAGDQHFLLFLQDFLQVVSSEPIKTLDCVIKSQYMYLYFLFFISESLTPLVLSMQKQFNFEYILASATAVGKVSKCS